MKQILEARILEGYSVRLEPVTEDHRQEMSDALNCDLESWQIGMASGMGAHFPAYWDAMIGTAGRSAFAIYHRPSGRLAGTSSYLGVDPRNRTLEIGSTWLRPEYRGTRVNAESKLLMLGEAFAAGALRVAFAIDSRNVRSQAAVRKLGAREEGILRRHRITWTGHKRDTVLFSIIDKEWPEVKARLEARLAD